MIEQIHYQNWLQGIRLTNNQVDLVITTGVGPRVADHTLDTLHLVPFPSWEDLRLKTP